MQLLKKDIRPNCLQDVLLEQRFAIVLQAVLLQPISMAPQKMVENDHEDGCQEQGRSQAQGDPED